MHCIQEISFRKMMVLLLMHVWELGLKSLNTSEQFLTCVTYKHQHLGCELFRMHL